MEANVAPRRAGERSVARPALAADGWSPLIFVLAAVVFSYVWRMQDLYPILATIQFPSVVSLLALGMFVTDQDPRRTLAGIRHPILNWAAVILALAVISIPTSLWPGRSFHFVVDDLAKNFTMMVLIAASIRSVADVRRYAFAILVGGAIYAWFVYTKVAVGIGGRLGDIVYYDANDLGMLLVCTIPLGVFFVVRAPQIWQRLLSLAVLVLFILVIVKTGSRGAFLGLLAVCAYLLVAYRSIPVGTRIGAVLGAFILLSAVAGEQYWTMMETMVHPEQDYNWSGQAEGGRMEVWKRGMGYMLNRPLTGVGASAFPIAEGTISPLADRQALGIGIKWSAAHNSFVEIGAELGVGGLLALLAVLWRAFRVSRGGGARRPGSAPRPEDMALGHALAGTIIGYMVSGFFLSQAYAAYTFAIYGMILGFAKATSEPDAEGLAPAPVRTSRHGVRAGVRRGAVA